MLFEKIQGQLADGVDLIGVGVLQQVLALVQIGFVQDALKERSLALEAFHRENVREAFTRNLLSSSSSSSFLLSDRGLQGSFHPVPCGATHGSGRCGLPSRDQKRDQGRQGQHASLSSCSSRASSSSCTSDRGHNRGFYDRGDRHAFSFMVSRLTAVLPVGRVDVTSSSDFFGSRPEFFREHVVLASEMSFQPVACRGTHGSRGSRFSRSRQDGYQGRQRKNPPFLAGVTPFFLLGSSCASARGHARGSLTVASWVPSLYTAQGLGWTS